MSYELKIVSPENEDVFYDLMRENLTACGAIYDDFHEGYQGKVAADEAVILYFNGLPVGAALIENHRGINHSYLSDVFVTSDERKNGHGRALVGACEKLAVEFGQHSMGLKCTLDLRHFYMRLGYEDGLPEGENCGMTKALRP